MRNNNIGYDEYEKLLDEAGITPEQECQDIIELINGKPGWYAAFREKVETYLEHLQTGKQVKVGRKSYTAQEYLNTFICEPVEVLTRIERRRPPIDTPNGDGTFNRTSDLTDDERKECRLLHWIYIELETISHRTNPEWKRA